jgi:hypothetical protein
MKIRDIGNLLLSLLHHVKRRISVVAEMTGYGLDDRVVGVRVSTGSRIFTFPPIILSNGYGGCFPEVKSTAAWRSLLTSNKRRGQANVGLYSHSPKRLYDLVLIYVIFEAFTAVAMKNVVFWVLTPCGFCWNRRFGGTYRHHHCSWLADPFHPDNGGNAFLWKSVLTRNTRCHLSRRHSS